jgi:hypothetical protein
MRELQQQRMREDREGLDSAEPLRRDVASGRPVDDPYEHMDVSQMLLPVLVALACFFPVLYCLCKL